MLKVRCARRLGRDAVTVDDNGVVIVEDEFGNPLVVVAYIQPQVCTIVTADDPDFNRVLQGLGIDKLVINEPVSFSMPLPKGNVKLLRGPAGFST